MIMIHTGKPYPEQETTKDKMLTGSFNRVAAGGSFKVQINLLKSLKTIFIPNLLLQVDVPVSSEDAYPPGAVTDLAVTVIDQPVNNGGINITIHLKWTAPGDELDTGTGF